MRADRVLLGVVVLVLTALSLLLVKGDGPGSGEMLLGITRQNGVNSGDLPIIGLWLVGVGCCGALWRHGR
ncbi:hypothetical protein [Nocardioides dongxiaopingii]|uniref:hypothetical protein n=1 Tax=Nocardioides dongxiaopingii TaxID=2576036 RepID=UPI0010C76362|nr:hypothetical protein [Nocardioides dongxiaopingii]